MIDAEEAERMGLVARIIPAERLVEEAVATAQHIASFSRPAVLLAKECVNRAFETSLAEGIRFERRMFHAFFATEGQKEGMAAFIQKRPSPLFESLGGRSLGIAASSRHKNSRVREGCSRF